MMALKMWYECYPSNYGYTVIDPEDLPEEPDSEPDSSPTSESEHETDINPNTGRGPAFAAVLVILFACVFVLSKKKS